MELNAFIKFGVTGDIIIGEVPHWEFESLKKRYPKKYDCFQKTEWIQLGNVVFYKR